MKKNRVKHKLISIIIIIQIIISGVTIILPLTNIVQPANGITAWTQTSDTDFNSGNFKNVELVGSGSDAGIMLQTERGWVKKETDNSPFPRNEHEMAAINGTDKILLFGGYNGTHGEFSDTWIYDFSENTWIEINTTTKPDKRNWHAMATVFDDDKVIMHGGTSIGLMGDLGDIWSFDLRDITWTELNTNGPSDARHTFVSFDGSDEFVKFGGRSFNYRTYIYNISDNNWTLHSQPTNLGERFEHSMASIFGTDSAILFGGTDITNEYFNDLWSYNLTTDIWKRLDLSSDPSKRIAHAMTGIWGTKNVFMFGGQEKSKLCDDTWIYYSLNDTWSTLKTPKKPSARSGHAIAPIHGTDNILLFGGNDGNDLDDTWVYHPYLAIENGIYTSTPYNTNARPKFKTLSWSGEVPSQSFIKLQLRSADSKKNLSIEPFVGPDGDNNTFYIKTSSTIWSGHNDDQWMQYRVYINSSNKNEIPVFNDITITYNILPKTNLLEPINKIEISSNQPTFTWEISDDSSGQVRFQLQIDDSPEFLNTDFDFGDIISNSTYYTSSIEISDGIWYWRVRAMDNDGDWGLFSEPESFIIDTVPPKSTILEPKNNSFFNYLDIISGTSYDPWKTPRVNKVEIAIIRLNDDHYWSDSNWIAKETWLLTYGDNEWEYDPAYIDWTSGSQYKIISRATDNVSNVEAPDDSVLFYYDSNDPVSSIENPLNNRWYNTPLENISGFANDSIGSGIDIVEMSLRNKDLNRYWNGVLWVDSKIWLTTSGAEDWYYNSTEIEWLQKKIYIVNTRATDKLGNKEFPGPKNSFRFDFRAPKNLEVLINDGEKFSNSTKLKLSLSATDTVSGVWQMAFSTDNETWTDWMVFFDTYHFFVPKKDGELTLFFKVRDFANNTAIPVSDSIIIDTKAPYDLSIIINNGENETNNTLVILDLNASDETSGVYMMSFSPNGVTWSSWVDFTNRIEHYLTKGNGEKTVYFRVKDKAGYITEPVRSSIILNTTKPENYKPPDEEDVIIINEPDSSSQYIIVWALLAILIIVILGIYIIVRNKKNQTKMKLLLAKSKIVKREKIPEKIEAAQITPKPKPDQEIETKKPQ
jgi:hypothetical protein